MTKREFVRTWCAIAYLFPGLHPEGYDDANSGWPRVLKRFAAEAWRSADAGELADDEMYPCDATVVGPARSNARGSAIRDVTPR